MNKWEQGFEEEIRKKLSQAPEDFDELAWEKMEQKLSAGASGKRRVLPLWWLRGAAALIILGLGIWAYTSFFQRQGPAVKQSGERYAAQDPSGAGNPESGLPEGHSDGDKEVTGEKKPAPGEEAETKDKPNSRFRGNKDIREEKQDDRFPKNDRVLAETDGTLAETGRTPAKTNRALTAITRPDLETRISDFSVESPSASSPAVKWPLEADLSTARAPGSFGTEEEPASESAPAGSKLSFSLGILAAPDLNAVKSFDKGKIGFNTGLSLGVHFNDRLSLHTGIVYSKKPYDARPADYHTRRPVPDLVNIAANCDVIDIPLNLRYAVYRKGLNSISLDAGLSSYLMLKEKYSYDYANYDSRVYEYKNESQHFMGVGNVGVVFERRLNDKISIGLQPFIKVPLTGIGHGNVKLISTGAAIQLNLNMNKK